ncbi:MAG: HdeD family acid-resistance protein [Planctomycetota bacterium]|jgi:uncharacterized membrane protein HdeD (DUF308 family)
MAANNSMFGPFSRLAPLIQEDLKRLKDSSIYFLILGAALAALGVCSIGYAALFTIASMEVLGFLLVVGGAMFVGGSFFTGNWGGFFLTLLMGVLQLNVGLMCIRHPAEIAIVYTLLMAFFFMVGGLFRIFAAVASPFRGRGLILLNGIVTLMLGVMIWHQMPFSGLWVIGTFMGIDLIFTGISYFQIGLEVRRLPDITPEA